MQRQPALRKHRGLIQSLGPSAAAESRGWARVESRFLGSHAGPAGASHPASAPAITQPAVAAPEPVQQLHRNNPTTILVSIASLPSIPPALVLHTRLPVYIPNQVPIRHPRSVSEKSRHDGRASVAPPPGSAQHRHGMWTPSRMPSCAERMLTIFSQVLGFAASCCGAATCSAVCSACGKCGNRLVTLSPSSRDAWLTIG